MVNFDFLISRSSVQTHKIVKTKTFPVSTNKTIELGIYKNNSVVGLSFSIRLGKVDHPGFNFSLDFLGNQLEFDFYDNRHEDNI